MKKKKLPERTCVGCRQVKAKKELLRVVRDPLGVISIDPTGKRAGRGAYICPSPACLEKAIAGKRLERALERPIDAALLETLKEQLAVEPSGRDNV
ncbi:MAG TPA: YlxR family protein [Firmicutes bacterium]|nr:YlxR family protein [Bacillota bacterium]